VDVWQHEHQFVALQRDAAARESGVLSRGMGLGNAPAVPYIGLEGHFGGEPWETYVSL
jgi:hypothetical protein